MLEVYINAIILHESFCKCSWDFAKLICEFPFFKQMGLIRESKLIGKKTPRALQDKWNTEYQSLGTMAPDLTTISFYEYENWGQGKQAVPPVIMCAPVTPGMRFQPMSVAKELSYYVMLTRNVALYFIPPIIVDINPFPGQSYFSTFNCRK